MNSKDYWQLFMTTGAPAFYTAYQAKKRTEDTDVSQNTGSCPPADGVQ